MIFLFITFQRTDTTMKYCAWLMILSFVTFALNAQLSFPEGKIACRKVKSLFQEDSTNIMTIQTKSSASDSVSIIFILPVEEQKENQRFGSGIEEVRDLIDSNLIGENVVFVQPEFTRIPWYGDHPADTHICQEKYLIQIINQVTFSFSNRKYKIFLLGFSKSGWGCLSVMCNFPQLIDGIFIWDAPLSTGFNKEWGMDQVFRDKDYFDNYYRLTNRIGNSADMIRKKTIVIGGYDLFQKQTKTFLKFMDANQIQYHCNPALKYKHEWNKEWILSLLRDKNGIVHNK